ncbi:hypothetical protein ACFLZX_06530 [Nanoarchaeota archaeon]
MNDDPKVTRLPVEIPGLDCEITDKFFVADPNDADTRLPGILFRSNDVAYTVPYQFSPGTISDSVVRHISLSEIFWVEINPYNIH